MLSAIRRKVTLKTELALETARVQQLLPTLTADEHSELCAALAAEDFKLDQDTLHATSRLEAQWHSSGSTFIATTKEDLRL